MGGRDVKVEDGLESVDDDGSSEDSEVEAPFVSDVSLRQIELNQSIYDDALLAPLIRPKSFVPSWSLLLLNFLLQIWTLRQITFLVDDAFADSEGTVFGEQGLCTHSPASFVPHFNTIGVKPPLPQELLLNCVPDEVFFMYNWSYIDMNGDGVWTKDEAARLTKVLKNSQADLEDTHGRMVVALQDTARNVMTMPRYANDEDAHKQARKVLEEMPDDSDRIPKEIFNSQISPFLDMCLLMDERLCGNLIFRKAFNRSTFLHRFESTGYRGAPLAFLERNPHSGGEVHDEVRLCKQSINLICPQFFSVTYDLWTAKRKELCGEPSTQLVRIPHKYMANRWDALNENLLVVIFEQYENYKDVQLDRTYMCFVALILILWSMSMMEEVRAVTHWWRVLGGSFTSAVVYEAQEEDECTVRFNDMSLQYRMLQIMQLTLRTAICFIVLIIGTRYLILSGGYEDLIMNSLALTFLVTIDEMIFIAFVPSRRKSWNEKAEPPHAASSACWDGMFASVAGNSYILVLIVFLYVTAHLLYEYKRPNGKDDMAAAFKCICQVAGETCLASYVVGGYPSVMASPDYN